MGFLYLTEKEGNWEERNTLAKEAHKRKIWSCMQRRLKLTHFTTNLLVCEVFMLEAECIGSFTILCFTFFTND